MSFEWEPGNPLCVIKDIFLYFIYVLETIKSLNVTVTDYLVKILLAATAQHGTWLFKTVLRVCTRYTCVNVQNVRGP